MRNLKNHRSGFSLVEVLIAMGVVVIAVVGLLPLFARSVVENLEGKESTIIGNQGRSEVESYNELSFNNWELQITAGTERVLQEYYTTGSPDYRGDESWVQVVPGGELAPWRRTTTIRQLGMNRVIDTDLDGIIDDIQGLEDDDYDGVFDNALPAGTIPGAIHLKQVEVDLEAEKEWAQGGEAMQMLVDTLKAF